MMSIERFALVNFWMNLLLVGVCARAAGRMRIRRILISSAVGTLYAIASYAADEPWLRRWPVSLACAVVMAGTAVGVRDPAKLARVASCLVICAALEGGALALIQQWLGGESKWFLLWAAPMTVWGMARLMDARSQRMERWNVRLLLCTPWGRVSVEAFVDTGNRLREPISGLPVVVADAHCLRPLAAGGLRLARYEAMSGDFRMIRYGALGGGGRMLCFRPEALYVSGKTGWRNAPDVWVALYPGRMPGSFHALAPLSIGRLGEM